MSEEILRGNYKDVDVIVVDCPEEADAAGDDEDEKRHLHFEGRKAEAAKPDEPVAHVTEGT